MPLWKPSHWPTAERLATFLILAIYLVWVLSLPAWPSQDGPVHLFYTHVLGQLLGHKGTGYASFFTIKHLLPPYALYYYLLLGLSHLVPLLLADRLVVCAYLAIFLTGFHALARMVAPASGRSADRATLLATLLLLNWPLGMGFVNYCLSLALALWALATWFHLSDGAPLRRRIAFLTLVVVITLTHPVPLLLVLGVAGLDLCTRHLRTSQLQVDQPLVSRADFVTLGLAATPLLYVKFFAASSLLQQRTRDAGLVARIAFRAKGYVQGKSLSFLFGPALGVDYYRAALFATLVLALAAAAYQLLRNRRARQHTTSDLFAVLALLLLLLLPTLPSEISGAYFFPERLVLVVWIFALLGATGWPSPKAVPQRRGGFTLQTLLTTVLILFAGSSSAALLVSANKVLRPLGQQSRALEQASLLHPGEVVLSLEGTDSGFSTNILPSWDPQYWMAVHAIRGSDAVLANAPWLDSPIIPLAARPSLSAADLLPQLANSPAAVAAWLLGSPREAPRNFSNVEAVFFTGAPQQSGAIPKVLSAIAGDNTRWSCAPGVENGQQLCSRLR